MAYAARFLSAKSWSMPKRPDLKVVPSPPQLVPSRLEQREEEQGLPEEGRSDTSRSTPIQPTQVPLSLSPVSAGFPSPAEDFVETQLNLHQHVVRHPAATFFVRVSGDSMTGAGIYSGDLLVVDRSLRAKDGDVVVAVVNGEFTVKRLVRGSATFGPVSQGGRWMLLPENPQYKPITMHQWDEWLVWGVVTHCVHQIS